MLYLNGVSKFTTFLTSANLTLTSVVFELVDNELVEFDINI